jgi:CDP-4-dehydro-6-deoxyglucose reductase
VSFQITLEPSALSFAVEPDETILAAAIREGVGMPYGCRDGACGSCKSRLVSGRVEHGSHNEKALSAEEAQAGMILACRAVPRSDCVVEARAVAGAGDFPILKMPSRVLGLERAARDVIVLRMQLPANQNFRYRAGQYVEFILRDGDRRSYSIANAPHTLGQPPTIELHLRHLPGGKFTDQAFTTLKERDILRMEGPFGSFFLRADSDKPIVLLASGTGFAPIKAVIEQMQANGNTRPTTLYWGCRRPADLYRDDWCRQQAAATPWLRYVPVLSEAQPGDGWDGRAGFVHLAVMADFPDLSGHEVYACGVPVMVDTARRDFIERCGLSEDDFYADSFTSEADKH